MRHKPIPVFTRLLLFDLSELLILEILRDFKEVDFGEILISKEYNLKMESTKLAAFLTKLYMEGFTKGTPFKCSLSRMGKRRLFYENKAKMFWIGIIMGIGGIVLAIYGLLSPGYEKEPKQKKSVLLKTFEDSSQGYRKSDTPTLDTLRGRRDTMQVGKQPKDSQPKK